MVYKFRYEVLAHDVFDWREVVFVADDFHDALYKFARYCRRSDEMVVAFGKHYRVARPGQDYESRKFREHKLFSFFFSNSDEFDVDEVLKND